MPGKPSLDRPECRALTATGRPCKKRAASGSAFCGVHGGQRRQIGRPTRLTAELIERITYAVERGLTWQVAAQAAGVHDRTLFAWRERGEQEDEEGRDTVYALLHRELTRARAAAEADLVEAVRRHAVGPHGDWRAAAFLLERKHPERWARRDKLDVDLNERAKPREVEPPADRRDEVLAILRTATQPPAEPGT